MKLRFISLGIAFLLLAACAPSEPVVLGGTNAPQVTPDSSEPTAPQASASAEALGEPGGMDTEGCELIRTRIAGWIDESQADLAVANVLGVLDQIAPLVSKPGRTTVRDLKRANALIQGRIPAAVQAVPNLPVKEIPKTSLDLCDEREALDAYRIASRPLRTQVDEIISLKWLGVTEAGAMLQQIIDFDLRSNKELVRSHAVVVDNAVTRAQDSLAPIVEILGSYRSKE